MLRAPLVYATSPVGTRTGDAIVDHVLDALEDGSRDALRAVLNPEPIGCANEHSGVGGPPLCRDGEELGTPIDTILTPNCESGPRRLEPTLDMLGRLAAVGPRVYMVTKQPAFVRVAGPDRWSIVLQIETDFEGEQGPEVVVDDVGVVAILWSCGLGGRSRLGSPTNSEDLLLPPR